MNCPEKPDSWKDREIAKIKNSCHWCEKFEGCNILPVALPQTIQHLTKPKNIDGDDYSFTDEDADEAFPEFDFQNLADVADHVRGREGKKCPENNKRQFSFL